MGTSNLPPFLQHSLKSPAHRSLLYIQVPCLGSPDICDMPYITGRQGWKIKVYIAPLTPRIWYLERTRLVLMSATWDSFTIKGFRFISLPLLSSSDKRKENCLSSPRREKILKKRHCFIENTSVNKIHWHRFIGYKLPQVIQEKKKQNA